jgi:hypothetical protein
MFNSHSNHSRYSSNPSPYRHPVTYGGHRESHWNAGIASKGILRSSLGALIGAFVGVMASSELKGRTQNQIVAHAPLVIFPVVGAFYTTIQYGYTVHFDNPAAGMKPFQGWGADSASKALRVVIPATLASLAAIPLSNRLQKGSKGKITKYIPLALLPGVAAWSGWESIPYSESTNTVNAPITGGVER